MPGPRYDLEPPDDGMGPLFEPDLGDRLYRDGHWESVENVELPDNITLGEN